MINNTSTRDDPAQLPDPTGRLDWRARTLLKAMEAVGWPKVSESAVARARRDLRLLLDTTSVWRPVARVQESHAVGPKGNIPLRIYTPLLKRDGDAALLVWFHGGGFVLGDLDTADPTCRALAEKSGAVVVSVDYRLCPEHAFDDGVNDAYAAALWAFSHARALGCDPARVAIGGDSAGGTFTALVTQRLRDTGGPRPAAQVLVYPCTDCSQAIANHDPDVAKFLTWDTVAWFTSHSHPGRDLQDPTVSPYYHADLSGLPPAVLVTAECDLLCTDGEAYAAKLRAAGVPVGHRRYDGQIHGFFMMDLVFPAARRAQRFVADAIRAMQPVAQSAITEVDSLPASVATLSPLQRWTKVLAERSPVLVTMRLGATLFDHWRSSLGGTAKPLPRSSKAVFEETVA
ncbi:MAG: alpha/beta hydrolase [Pseudomonadota bacterium]|jgi:acetyl esterase